MHFIETQCISEPPIILKRGPQWVCFVKRPWRAVAYSPALSSVSPPDSQAAEWPVSGKLKGKDGKKAEDVSGIACSGALEFPRDCLVIDDETQFAQWARRLEGGKRVLSGENLPLIDDELDGKAVRTRWRRPPLVGTDRSSSSDPSAPHGAPMAVRPTRGAAQLKADSHVFRLTPTAKDLWITDSNALRALILADADLRPFADQPLAENGLTVGGTRDRLRHRLRRLSRAGAR